ncbi:MAG: hypothetical protein LBJ89_02270, partial [Holosporales bacterium]|nr:hypothetical protein [Holosporales bacterium]
MKILHFYQLMNIVKSIRSKIGAILTKIGNIDVSKVQVDPTKDPTHGELATNAAMVFCKVLGLSPRVLAERLIAEISKFDEVE